jgi:cyclic lactone autoinducer peptide
MRRWILKHASGIVTLVGLISLIPMTTTCRMFIGQPDVPDELIR